MILYVFFDKHTFQPMEDFEKSQSQGNGGYKRGKMSFTIIRHTNLSLDDRLKTNHQRCSHVSITENPFYKKTARIALLRKKSKKLELEIKALYVMLGEKTEEDDLYEEELEILRSKYSKLTRLQQKIEKESIELKKMLRNDV